MFCGTGEALLSSIKKYKIGTAITVINIASSSIPKSNDSLGAIRYIIDKLRYMYASSKNRKFIFYILFGSHRYQFKMEVIIGKKLVKKVIIRFYYDSIITLLQKYCKKSGIKLKQKDVAFKFYYK